MHCQDCEYPLWNLKARECPECGKPFVPSEHHFVANSVRFCCLHCDQEYYGTDARGHLVPREFECVKCGAAVSMDEMILRPAEGVADTATRANTMPWLDRERGSIVKPWLRTVGRSMVSPGRLVAAVPPGSPVSAAWWYAVVTITIILLIGAGLPLFGFGLTLLLFGENDGADIMVGGAWAMFGGVSGFLAVLAVWGLVVHGLLRVTGNVTHTIGRTYQALCYTIGANVTSAVPCIGIYPFLEVGLVWWVVAATIAVVAAHRVSGGRASFTVITLPVAVVLLGVAGFFGLMYFGMSQARIAVASAQTKLQDTETARVVEGLVGYAETNDGVWPAHVVELVRDETLAPWDLVSSGSATVPASIPVAGTDLEALAGETDAARDTVVEKAIAGQPEDIVAYRFGDYVFCYPGVTPDFPPATWIVILAVDPERNEFGLAGADIVVGRLDATTELIPVDEFDARLAEQNASRVANGLMPLPPPSEITHPAPVRGP